MWKEEKITLCISEEILQEYIEVLLRLGLEGESELEELLELFKKQVNISFFSNVHEIEIIKEDPEDNKFIGCTLTGGAVYIISEDNHLLKQKV